MEKNRKEKYNSTEKDEHDFKTKKKKKSQILAFLILPSTHANKAKADCSFWRRGEKMKKELETSFGT